MLRWFYNTSKQTVSQLDVAVAVGIFVVLMRRPWRGKCSGKCGQHGHLLGKLIAHCWDNTNEVSLELSR